MRLLNACETLVFMGEYAGFRFSTEGRLFERYGYLGAVEHRRVYAVYVGKVGGFRGLFGEAGVEAVFLGGRVEAHMLGVGGGLRRVAWQG